MASALWCRRPLTSGAKAEGRFGKQDFVYLPEQDAYRCPAGETPEVAVQHASSGNGMTLRHYWTTKCPELRHQGRSARTGKERRVTRWEHEGVLDAMQKRLDQVPDSHAHPAGRPSSTRSARMKAWMGATHFLTRTLKRVGTEMSLQVLAYNMKRVIAILGAGPLMQAIRV